MSQPVDVYCTHIWPYASGPAKMVGFACNTEKSTDTYHHISQGQERVLLVVVLYSSLAPTDQCILLRGIEMNWRCQKNHRIVEHMSDLGILTNSLTNSAALLRRPGVAVPVYVSFFEASKLLPSWDQWRNLRLSNKSLDVKPVTKRREHLSACVCTEFSVAKRLQQFRAVEKRINRNSRRKNNLKRRAPRMAWVMSR